MLEIIQKFNDITSKDPIFWFCALTGSGMFVIQFILSLFGADNHSDIESANSELDAVKFKWLSKQAVFGFVMMFGWVGLTCKKEFELSLLSSALIGCFAGCIAIFISAFIFKISRNLHSSGTVFRIEDAIGKEAMVYHRIPPGGIGKVSVSLHDFTHEIDAISAVQKELPSFMSVRIIKMADEKTVIVVPKK